MTESEISLGELTFKYWEFVPISTCALVEAVGTVPAAGFSPFLRGIFSVNKL